MPRVRVKESDLPPVGPNGKYLVRFRVVSVDENRTSHWVYKEVDWEYMLAVARTAEFIVEDPDAP